MALVLRSDKGSPLLATEIDGNFTYLKGLIDGLSAGITAEGIASVTVDAEGLLLTGTEGSSWGPFPIQIPLHARGEWITATAYVQNDLIQKDNLLLLALSDHTSGDYATDLAAGRIVVAYTGATGGSGGGDGGDGGSGGDVIGLPEYPTWTTADGFRVALLFDENPDSPSSSWNIMNSNMLMDGGQTQSLAAQIDALEARIAALEAH